MEPLSVAVLPVKSYLRKQHSHVVIIAVAEGNYVVG